MIRLTLVLVSIAVTLVGIGYLLHLNPDEVTVRLSSTQQWQAPLPFVLVATFLLGAAVTFLFSLLRAGRHALSGWRRQRGTQRARRQQLRKEQGLGYAWLGEHERARAVLSKALRDRPDDLAAFLLFARTYIDEGNHARAIELLQEGLDTRGPDPKLLLFLAHAQRERGEVAAAIETLERARRADPASPQVLGALCDAHVAAERWADAARVQTELLPLLQDPIARTEAEQRLIGMRYESALRQAAPAARATELAALVRAHPDFVPAAVSLGDALVESGQTKQAERVWRRAVGRGARSGVIERLERLLAGSQVHRLDSFMRRLVRRQPDDGTIRLFRARQLVRAGALEDAASELAQVGPPWTGLASYHALLAEIQVRRSAYDDAVTAFRQALAATDGAFHCARCGASADEWRARCTACLSWGTYRSSFDVNGGAAPGVSASAGGAAADGRE